MSLPLWVTELAAAFWREVGDSEPFPRTLRHPIARTLPLLIVSLPRLRITDINDWLAARAVVCRLTAAQRPLRACLVAHSGAGVIFLDGGDGEDEQRFSLAHELAHFLRHYRCPRERAVEHFGDQILEVFDGERAPRQPERVHSLLAGVPLGFHVHLMERDYIDARSVLVERAESEADLLAYELLAPSDLLLNQVGQLPAERNRVNVEAALTSLYGLPTEQAARYAALLMPRVDNSNSLVRRLRMVK